MRLCHQLDEEYYERKLCIIKLTYIIFNVADGLRLRDWLHQKGSFLVVVVGLCLSIGFSFSIWSGLSCYQD